MTSGYSGTPLAKKLSLKGGMRVWWDGMPGSVRDEIEAEGLDLQLPTAPEAPIDAAHIFVTERVELEARLKQLLALLDRAGMIWVSWPKKASRVRTDITEDVIRDVALPMHLVDVKVCSVDDVWSGLKLMIRKEHRRRGDMMRQPLLKPILLATLVCGALDIFFAMILTILRGKDVAAMLRFVASGPIPDATHSGAAGSLLGLAVHFTLMAIMVTAYVLLAPKFPHNLDMPFRSGIAYGVVSWAAMNLVVVPLRFPAAWPPTKLAIATQLFAHIVLVGLPTAYITRRYLRR